MMRRATLVGLMLLLLSSCGSATGSESAQNLDYGSERVAPLRSEVVDLDIDESPSAENSLVELDLDGGGRAAFWIDPDDIAHVFVQYSDPENHDAWTAPALVYAAGDGCLYVNPVSAGTTVAVGLGCYQTDTFAQQAPDEGVALVSTDFITWEETKMPDDSYPQPEVSQDGEMAVFNSLVYQGQVDARWELGEGFK